MADTYVWTPPGATPEAIEKFLSLRPGIPDYMRESVIDWFRRGKYNHETADIGFLLRYQTVAKQDIGMRAGAHVKHGELSQFLRTLDQETFASLIHFLLSEIHLPNGRYRDARAEALQKILAEGGSSWMVGTVQGRLGLVERIPSAVAATVENVISSADKASGLLQKAWELAFGANKSPSHAYFDAVRAVEVLSCPLFSPKDKEPTLGKDINVLRNKPTGFEFVMSGSKQATATEHLLSMMQLLWHSQSDRHGSDDYQDVSVEEAQAAVLLASTLIGWFSKGMIRRVSA